MNGLISIFELFIQASIFIIGTEPMIFEGRTEGTIVPARGPKVFGWDAIFEPNGTGLT